MDSNEPEVTYDSPVKKNNFRLEPSLFLLIFGWALTSAVFTNQLEYQTCTAVYHYNASTCALLGKRNESNTTMEIESQVQPYVANILLAKQLMEILICTFMCLRCGPWSDLHGRKPILVMVYAGAFIQFVIITVILGLSTKIDIDPWWYLIASLPLAITGGNPVLTTVAFSYVSDITENHNRAFRNGIFQGVVLMGVLLGSISSGYLNDATNPTIVFMICTTCSFLALLHIILFLNETVTDRTRHERCNDIIQPKLYKEMFYTAIKPRENYDRIIIWIILAAIGLASFCTDGTMAIFFLFLREKFQWTIQNYTAYMSANMTFGAIGSILTLVGLKKLFGVSDTILTIIGYMSAMGQSLIIALANQSWHMYASLIVGGMKNISIVACRSILTNMGSDDDIGKMNALVTTVESIFQLIGAPIFTQLYKSTLNSYPGAFNLLSVLLFFIDSLLLIIVYVIQVIITSVPAYRGLSES